MHINRINAFFSVGTRFIASGDSSPWLEMNPGHPRVDRVHGDKSPDGIHAVPTEKIAFIVVKRYYHLHDALPSHIR